MDTEYRSLGTIDNIGEGRIVEGYAVRFNEPSKILCEPHKGATQVFREIILPGAITEELILRSDIFARIDHRKDIVLARCKNGEGSLQLEIREDGLYYMFEAPHTQWGDELLEHIKRGEICESSFGFRMPIPESYEYEEWKRENGELIRTVKKITCLTDVSAVYNPAYSTTTCSKRCQEIVDGVQVIDSQLDSQMCEVDELCKNILDL